MTRTRREEERGNVTMIRDGHKGKRKRTRLTLIRSTTSLSMVFVTEFIITKVKNEVPWKDSGFVQEKE